MSQQQHGVPLCTQYRPHACTYLRFSLSHMMRPSYGELTAGEGARWPALSLPEGPLPCQILRFMTGYNVPCTSSWLPIATAFLLLVLQSKPFIVASLYIPHVLYWLCSFIHQKPSCTSLNDFRPGLKQLRQLYWPFVSNFKKDTPVWHNSI